MWLVVEIEGGEVLGVEGPFDSEYQADRYAGIRNNVSPEDRFFTQGLKEPLYPEIL